MAAARGGWQGYWKNHAADIKDSLIVPPIAQTPYNPHLAWTDGGVGSSKMQDNLPAIGQLGRHTQYMHGNWSLACMEMHEAGSARLTFHKFILERLLEVWWDTHSGAHSGCLVMVGKVVG